jgi:hypothetical protein
LVTVGNRGCLVRGHARIVVAACWRHYGGMSMTRKCFLFCLCLVATLPVRATPLFESDGVIDVELLGPLTSLIGDKESRKEYPFVLRSGGVDLEIDVRVRGKSRLEICEFPPLRLNFDRAGAVRGPFAGQGGLKLVTHCRGGDRGSANAVEEYLTYRIFGLLSDISYRVRLLRIRYSDTEHGVQAGEPGLYAFVIEPGEQLAQRVGGVPTDVPGIALAQLDPGQAALVYVFQYMIGNTDWSFATAEGEDNCCHNGDLFARGEAIYYVPYDFDLAGIVNASYARPLPEMRLRSVRQRRYRGFCTDSETLGAAIASVNARRDEIFGLIRNTPGLTEKGAEKTIGYLAGFFDKSADEDRLLRSFERDCLDD